ncbi:GH16015 [Drosophila grimshawi]|uniref:GH16015 n=1 Tax=Drosophila grimshawi TaxID=7222 RepID=B4J2G5_DROGR|nr:GH16015 [Drosophila grimshawi]
MDVAFYEHAEQLAANRQPATCYLLARGKRQEAQSQTANSDEQVIGMKDSWWKDRKGSLQSKID